MTNEEAIDELNVIYERLSHPDACSKGVYSFSDGYYLEALDMAIQVLEQKPKTGHWINLEETKCKGQVLPFWGRYECSECGNHGQDDFNFCPNCGARMEV